MPWLLAAWRSPVGAIGAAALLCVFTGAIGISLAKGQRPPCGCFNSRADDLIGWPLVLRNVALVGLAVGVAVWGPRAAPLPVAEWLLAGTMGAGVCLGAGAASMLVRLVRVERAGVSQML